MKVDITMGSGAVAERHVVALTCFLTLVIGYCDRVNMAVAAPQIMQQKYWSAVQMSWVLSGFFLGYAIFLVPAGMLVQRVGATRVLGWSVAGWSLLTILTPAPRTLIGMYIVRFSLGIFESAVFPCINGLLAACFSREEYAKAAGFCWSGGYAGPILAFPLTAMILVDWGWRSIFYLFGIVGILWALFCWKLLSTLPPGRGSKGEVSQTRWSRIHTDLRLLQRREVWAVFVLHFSSNWFIYLLLTLLPTYLSQVRHLSQSMNAITSTLPFAAALLAANVFAVAIARLSRFRSPTRIRKLFLLVYALGAVVFVFLPRMQRASCLVGALVTSTALITAATPVYAAGSLELAPKVAGMLAGLQQAFANLAGVLAPLTSGYLARSSWSLVFVAAGVICLAGAATYLAFGSGVAMSLPTEEFRD